jgi:hypothetical protein
VAGRSGPEEPTGPAPALEPSWGATLLVSAVVLLLLLSSGRPIGAGDTRPTERVAASLVLERNLDLDEYPEVEAPFAREVAGHRVSIYPVLSAVLAAPVFALGALVFALDETGTALLGKIVASLLSALAAGILFRAIARRATVGDAWRAALVFALGTSVWSTSQALWQHPAAVLCLSVALLFLLRAEEDPVWAGRAGLPLALAVAARHADVALVAVLAIAVAWRWRRQIPWMIAWGAPAVLFVAAYDWWAFGSPLATGFSGSTADRFSAPWGIGHAGLLVSPAKGLFVFTPIVLVALAGLVRALRQQERDVMVRSSSGWLPAVVPGSAWIARACLAAFLAHWLFLGRWAEWHGGASWGPRMMTDALPLLFLFLPDGVLLMPPVAVVLALVSVGVQALGAFAYDYRWERLYQNPAPADHSELWSVARSPIVFHVREGVLLPSLPLVHDGKAVIHTHPVVMGSGAGSRITFAPSGLEMSGSEDTLVDVCLQRGAHVSGHALTLQGRWDGIFARVREGARPRHLQLRIDGRGEGVIYVGEQSFLSPPRWTAYPVSGRIHVRHPYFYADSGGPDLVVTLGKSPGHAELTGVALVSPTEPERVLELGGRP